ncbi:MAG: hypothetical protein E7436_00595 [Ruminococcaceae bacterium]|nr:hypothetical protein [Oscillospiraceae bacterium]
MKKYSRWITDVMLMAAVFWWCVVFQEICEPMADVQTGVSDVGATQEIQVRFWVLELWGRIQNFFGLS